MTEFSFTLHKTDGAARLGTVRTLHGDIRTRTSFWATLIT
jgi:hypothetical protein